MNIKRCAGMLLLLLGLALAAPLPPLSAQQLPCMMVVPGRFINVRKGPGTGYDQIATLYKGDRVEAERKYRNWLRVVLDDGRIGWVREDLIQPFDSAKLPLTDEQADSLKAVVDSGSGKITLLQDSSTVLLGRIRNREAERDSMLSMLGLSAMPPLDTLERKDTVVAGPVMPPPLPGSQASVLTLSREEYPERFAVTPLLGVLISDGNSLTAGGMSLERNFSREFAWKAQVAFARMDPELKGSLNGDFEHVFVTGGLVYNWMPGNMLVPYLEIGSGVVYTQATDSSFTALDLTFGAGFRLFLTPDLALRAGYQGHGMLAEGNRILHLVQVGASLHVPPYHGRRPGWPKGEIYLLPSAGWQMFSRRFAANGAPTVGLSAGYRRWERLALEAGALWQKIDLNDGLDGLGLNGLELTGRLLYYPWGGYSGPYIVVGGGALSLGGSGRPPEGTTRYGLFQYGAGADLYLGTSVALRGEMLHLVYTDVVPLSPPDGSVGAASALRAGMGLRVMF